MNILLMMKQWKKLVNKMPTDNIVLPKCGAECGLLKFLE